MFMGGDVMRIEDEVTVALMLTTARRTLLAGLSVVAWHPARVLVTVVRKVQLTPTLCT